MQGEPLVHPFICLFRPSDWTAKTGSALNGELCGIEQLVADVDGQGIIAVGLRGAREVADEHILFPHILPDQHGAGRIDDLPVRVADDKVDHDRSVGGSVQIAARVHVERDQLTLGECRAARDQIDIAERLLIRLEEQAGVGVLDAVGCVGIIHIGGREGQLSCAVEQIAVLQCQRDLVRRAGVHIVGGDDAGIRIRFQRLRLGVFHILKRVGHDPAGFGGFCLADPAEVDVDRPARLVRLIGGLEVLDVRDGRRGVHRVPGEHRRRGDLDLVFRAGDEVFKRHVRDGDLLRFLEAGLVRAGDDPLFRRVALILPRKQSGGAGRHDGYAVGHQIHGRHRRKRRGGRAGQQCIFGGKQRKGVFRAGLQIADHDRMAGEGDSLGLGALRRIRKRPAVEVGAVLKDEVQLGLRDGDRRRREAQDLRFGVGRGGGGIGARHLLAFQRDGFDRILRARHERIKRHGFARRKGLPALVAVGVGAGNVKCAAVLAGFDLNG